MSNLFLFTIGPVKSFIENSRKAMDLYAGSRMLSELMGEAVKWLKEKDGVKILFPFIPEEEENGDVNIPNRLVAEFVNCSGESMKRTAKELTLFVRQQFDTTCRELLKKAGISQEGIKLAEKQWKNFLEVYWAFEEYRQGEDGKEEYAEAYERLAAKIQEVKGIRPFSQTMEPWGRKCTLFPEYNAVFVKKGDHNGRKAYPYQTNPKYFCDITENEFLQYAVKKNEALSSIALVKRIYGKMERKTYSLRYMMLKHQIPDEMFEAAGIQETDNDKRDMIANGVYDLENGLLLEEEEYSPEAEQKAKYLHDLMKKQNMKLNSYYALIKFDGDSMGDAFKELKEVPKQQELSRSISKFASQVSGIISRYGGLPVFAGGEDFFGFLPLDSLFPCIKELRELFEEMIHRSFSAGVSIAHLMQPLKEVISCADMAEEAAKRLTGKNAFVISILKRSGDHVIMPAYKLTGEESLPRWIDIEELVQMLKNSQCSRSMMFQSTELMKYFSEDDKPESEMVKVLLKHCVLHSAAGDDQIDQEKLVEKLMLFYRSADHIRDFLHTLNGILFLSREVV